VPPSGNGEGPALPWHAGTRRIGTLRAAPDPVLDRAAVKHADMEGERVGRNGVRGDPQLPNSSGTSFPLNGGALIIAERRHGLRWLHDRRRPAPAARPRQEARFPVRHQTPQRSALRQFRAVAGRPGTTGIPQQPRGNGSIYAVADPMTWQDPEEADRTLNLFARAPGTPRTGPKLMDFSADFGLTFKGPVPALRRRYIRCGHRLCPCRPPRRRARQRH